ncbi:MAG: hypothetical protein QOJ40_1704 [Verrucomicrobiota bacterium]
MTLLSSSADPLLAAEQKRLCLCLCLFLILFFAFPLLAAEEKPVNFIPTKPNPLIGDWQGKSSPCVAQIYFAEDGNYQANLLKQFDTESNVLAVLHGTTSGDTITFNGDGWSATLAHKHFKGGKQPLSQPSSQPLSLGENDFKSSKDSESFDLQPITRTSPTLGAKPPKGAVVLFGGHDLDAWAKKNGKQWLTEDGPAQWKILPDGALEVVPGTDCIITHQKFGDCHLHVEFRTLGLRCNSGVFIQTRYEANINETYGRLDRSPNAGFDNCLPSSGKPRIRPCFPPLAWQTFDIDFRAPRFDASGTKTANARATLLFNGVRIYDNQELDAPHLAAGRLGEAPTGPLMLQEHGMPVQFRNIWLLETGRD